RLPDSTGGATIAGARFNRGGHGGTAEAAEEFLPRPRLCAGNYGLVLTHRLTHQYLLMYYSLMETTVTNPARVARWFHALSDETRLRIVDLLQRGERCVCELQDALGAAQSRLSFHLKVLREAGLVN